MHYRPFLLTLLLLLISNLISAADVVDTSWKSRTITVRLQQSNLNDALTQFSTQAKVSILVEGIPTVQGIASEEIKGKAGDVLKKLAEKYDYHWNETKEGVILLRKRFRNRAEMPQCDVKELVASLSEVQSSVRVVYEPIPYEERKSRYQKLLSSIPDEMKPVFRNKNSVQVASLSESQQAEVKRLVFQNLFDHLYLRLGEFDRNIKSLPVTYLETEPRIFRYVDNTTSTRRAFLIKATDEHQSSKEVFRYSIPRTNPPVDAKNVPVKSNEQVVINEDKASKRLFANSLTVSELLERVRGHYGDNLTASPETSGRKMMVFLNNASREQLVSGIAELYGWRWVETTSGGLRLERRQYQLPRNVAEVSKQIISSMPMDLWRFLTTHPNLNPDSVKLPYDYSKSGIRDFEYADYKIQELMTKLADNLYNELLPEIHNSKKEYKTLSLDQQETVKQIALCSVFKSQPSLLYVLSRGLTPLELDPRGSTILLEDTGYVISHPKGGHFGSYSRPTVTPAGQQK